MAATTLVGSVVVLGFAAVYQLSLATKGNAAGFLGFLVDAGFAVALYVSGYQGLKEGKVQQAKLVSGVLAVIAGLSAMLAFSGGDSLAFGMDLFVLAGMCLFLILAAAWKL